MPDYLLTVKMCRRKGSVEMVSRDTRRWSFEWVQYLIATRVRKDVCQSWYGGSSGANHMPLFASSTLSTLAPAGTYLDSMVNARAWPEARVKQKKCSHLHVSQSDHYWLQRRGGADVSRQHGLFCCFARLFLVLLACAGHSLTNDWPRNLLWHVSVSESLKSHTEATYGRHAVEISLGTSSQWQN